MRKSKIIIVFLLTALLLFGCQKTDIRYGNASDDPKNNPNYEESILDGKTAVFIGDSICAGKTVPEDSPEYGFGWGGIIGTKFNMNWVNLGRNGAVITEMKELDRIVSDQFEYAVKYYPEADYIIFEGGVNDADFLENDELHFGKISDNNNDFDLKTFSGAFESLVSEIITAYPEAKIGYIIPPKMGTSSDDSEYELRRKYFDRAIEICEKWGIPYLDLWNESELDPMLIEHYDPALTFEEANHSKYYTDGQHLTILGYYEIIPLIEDFILSL